MIDHEVSGSGSKENLNEVQVETLDKENIEEVNLVEGENIVGALEPMQVPPMQCAPHLDPSILISKSEIQDIQKLVPVGLECSDHGNIQQNQYVSSVSFASQDEIGQDLNVEECCELHGELTGLEVIREHEDGEIHTCLESKMERSTHHLARSKGCFSDSDLRESPEKVENKKQTKSRGSTRVKSKHLRLDL